MNIVKTTVVPASVAVKGKKDALTMSANSFVVIVFCDNKKSYTAADYAIETKDKAFGKFYGKAFKTENIAIHFAAEIAKKSEGAKIADKWLAKVEDADKEWVAECARVEQEKKDKKVNAHKRLIERVKKDAEKMQKSGSEALSADGKRIEKSMTAYLNALSATELTDIDKALETIAEFKKAKAEEAAKKTA